MIPGTTLAYYETHAGAYAQTNHGLAAPQAQARAFHAALMARPGHRPVRVLDAGCGTGRDSQVFLKLGAQVDAFDGSKSIATLAHAHTGLPVRQMTFEALDLPAEHYDGIWAMASLLHVAPKDLPGVFQALGKALRPGGLLFASFKHGQGVRIDEMTGRVFTDLDLDQVRALCATQGTWRLLDHALLDPPPEQRARTPWFAFTLERMTLTPATG